MSRQFCLGCMIVDTLSARRTSHNDHHGQRYDADFDAQLEHDAPTDVADFPSLRFRPVPSPVFSEVTRVLSSDRVALTPRVHRHTSRPVCPVCGWLTAARFAVA